MWRVSPGRHTYVKWLWVGESRTWLLEGKYVLTIWQFVWFNTLFLAWLLAPALTNSLTHWEKPCQETSCSAVLPSWQKDWTKSLLCDNTVACVVENCNLTVDCTALPKSSALQVHYWVLHFIRITFESLLFLMGTHPVLQIQSAAPLNESSKGLTVAHLSSPVEGSVMTLLGWRRDKNHLSATRHDCNTAGNTYSDYTLRIVGVLCKISTEVWGKAIIDLILINVVIGSRAFVFMSVLLLPV